MPKGDKTVTRPVRVALIGCGMISRLHVQAIRAQQDAVLAGVYDHLPELAANKAAEVQTACYARLEDLLADPDIDLVSICTPSGLHAAQAIQAIEAGKHVLIEKPIALNLPDSDAISAAARSRNLLVGVVSQLRFSQAIRDVKAALDAGQLGRIVSADLYMKYYRPQSYYAQNAWRGTRQMDGGGALMNQGIHGVDLLRYLCGPVTSIMAQARTLTHAIEVEDTLAAVVTYASGALGVIQATTSIYPGYPRRLEIHGERGSIILQEDTIVQWSIAGQPDKILEISNSAQHGHQNPEQISNAGHVAQYANFIAALRGREPLLVDDREGRNALEIIVKTYESAARQALVTL